MSACTEFLGRLSTALGLKVRCKTGGFLSSFDAGRRGLGINSPPQLGQMLPNFDSAHDAQKVHSKEQIRASVESGGKSGSQHSQPGRSSSILRVSFGETGAQQADTLP